MSLNDIVQSAQGGEAVNNLASRFGLTPDQTQSAINALLPALEMGLQNKLQGGGGGLGSILGQLASGSHPSTYSDPNAVDSGAAAQHGTSVLGELFGGAETNNQVAQQAATESGIPASVIQSMLPVLASLVISGLAGSAQGGGLGGILSQVLGGQGGALGSILGQVFGGQAAPGGQNQNQGGLGGLLGGLLGGQGAPGGQSQNQGGLGGLLGGLLGGGSQPQAAPGQTPASGDATLEELSRMFEAGTPSSPEHQANLANILGRN